MSSYTRERCGRDPISSSDWISGSGRGAWELLTPPLPQYPPFLRPLHVFIPLLLDLFLLLITVYFSCFSLHLGTWACLDYLVFPLAACINLAQSFHRYFVFPITFISSPALTPVSFKPPSYSSPSPCFLYALRTQLVSTQSWEALEVKEETEGRGVEGREGEGCASVELVGRSGAAPPVIIRVTAARARLCAACTRRDVLPREKSEHLSVPPRRQQPPTSLSNSTQLVTRSPNSYFLSLTHAHPL